jgi:hypothetical protein
LLGVLFQPTNTIFTNYAIANNQVVTQIFSRVVSEPDILFSAADIVSAPESGPTIYVLTREFPRFNTNGITTGVATPLAGPGTLGPPVEICYNRVGPIRLNSGPQFLDERTSVERYSWGSFDGTTNAPIIYPNGTDIANLESQVLLHISPASLSLPLDFVGQTNLVASGGVPYYQPPFTLALAPGSAPLPPGMTFSNGVITVSSLAAGGLSTNTITIRATDNLGNTGDLNYVIKIVNP